LPNHFYSIFGTKTNDFKVIESYEKK